MSEKLRKAELAELLAIPGFRKFIWRSIQMAGIFAPVANGSDGRNLVSEGRRNLGLEILHDVAGGVPVDDPQAAFNFLLLTILREEAQSQPSEKPNGRRNRYDRDGDSDDGDGSD